MRELCQLAGDWRGSLPEGGAMVEEKRDGWRALWIPDWRGEFGLYTRGGHPVEGTGHIRWRLAQMAAAAGEPMVFDGEFQVGGSLAATKAWCERGWKHGGEAGQFFAFDCLTLAEWKAGGSDRSTAARKLMLERLAGVAQDDWTWRPGSHGRDETAPPAVVVIPDVWCTDADAVRSETYAVWSRGGEGVMVKDAEAPYRRNRNDAWLKAKRANAHKWSPARAA